MESPLDLSQNIKLERLSCWDCNLTELDLTHNPLIQILYSSRNPLNHIDVSHLADLKSFNCSEINMTTLDVSNNDLLENLYCSGNYLTDLELNNNPRLERLYCSNNDLTTLNISQNTNLHTLKLEDMPSLIEVCVWTMPFPPERLKLSRSGSPNVYFTTDCSK